MPALKRVHATLSGPGAEETAEALQTTVEYVTTLEGLLRRALPFLDADEDGAQLADEIRETVS